MSQKPTKKLKPRRPPPLPLPENEQRSSIFPWWTTWPIAYLLLGTFGYLAYSNTLNGRLFFDDLSSIVGNPYIQTMADPRIREQIGWDPGDAFIHPKDSFEERKERGTLGWVDFFWSPIDNPFAGRPIVQFSFTLNHWWAVHAEPAQLQDFYGVTDLHYWYYHVVNLVFHIAVGFILWSLLRRVFRGPNFGGRFQESAPYWAFAITLLWLLHPINTETVVYVTQRTELVLAFFFLLTFYLAAGAATAATPTSRNAWQAGAVISCAFGMASKESMFAMPLLLVLFDRAFFYSSWRELIAHRIRFYEWIFATYFILIVLMLQAPRGESVGFHHERMPWYEYLITQCWCLWRYMWLSLIPVGSELCVDYGRRPVMDFQYVLPGALMIVAIVGGTIYAFFKKPWLAFLGCWYLFILAPTSSFVPIVTEVGAERRMYLPLVAVLAVALAGIVGGAWFWFRRVLHMSRVPDAALIAGGGLLMAVALIFGAVSYTRNIDYLSDRDLYGHIVRVFPDNDRGNNNFAKINVDMGERGRALELLNEAVRIDPEYSDAYTNRGIIFHNSKRFDVAIQNATEAIHWNPLNISAWNNRGNAFMEIKLWDRSIADFTEVIRVNKYGSDGYFGRANVYFSRGNEMDEEDYVRKGIAVPFGPRRSTESFQLALADCDSALERNPHDYKCFNTKGNVLKKLGKPLEAIEVFDLAIDTIRKESLSVRYTVIDEQKRRHPVWDAVEKALNFADQTTTFNNEIHRIALAHPHRATIAAIMGNRADAWRMLMLDPRNPDLSVRPKMLADLTRAIVFDPNNPEYFRVRGYYNLEFERWEQAISDLSRAAMLRPNYSDAVRGRLIGLMRLFRFPEAWQDAKRLRDMGTPLDGPSLDELKRKSGQSDYPP